MPLPAFPASGAQIAPAFIAAGTRGPAAITIMMKTYKIVYVPADT